MDILTFKQDGHKVFPLRGQFDALTVEQLRPSFTEIAENEQGDVWLDLSDVSFIDSSGIGAVVFMYKRLAARDKKLTITGLHGQPLDLLRFLRIDKTIPIETRDDGREFAVVS